MKGFVKVFAGNKESGVYRGDVKNRKCVFWYTEDNPISLVMPYREEPYEERFRLIPVFDQFIPEGWLFEYLKNHLKKRMEKFEDNDFAIFEILAPNVKSFLTFVVDKERKESEQALKVSLSEVLENDTFDLFHELVRAYLFRSAVSGLQPKVLVPLVDKSYVATDDYVVKTFGENFPHLAENEYFCMKAVKNAGIPVPEFWLSLRGKFFVTRRFTKDVKSKDKFWGFEEFCTLFGKTRSEKYYGSYESIAKALRKISSNPEKDLENYFKLVVMNFLLKNGDAHLKNFGVVYTTPYTGDVQLSPAYDVVSTVVYVPSDQPALTLFGKKVWFSKKELIRFGVNYCSFDKSKAVLLFDECESAVAEIKKEVELRAKERKGNGKVFWKNFLKVLEFSLTKNLKQSYKDLSKEVHFQKASSTNKKQEFKKIKRIKQ